MKKLSIKDLKPLKEENIKDIKSLISSFKLRIIDLAKQRKDLVNKIDKLKKKR